MVTAYIPPPCFRTAQVLVFTIDYKSLWIASIECWTLDAVFPAHLNLQNRTSPGSLMIHIGGQALLQNAGCAGSRWMLTPNSWFSRASPTSRTFSIVPDRLHGLQRLKLSTSHELPNGACIRVACVRVPERPNYTCFGHGMQALAQGLIFR